MASKGQIDFENLWVWDRVKGHRNNYSDDSPFVSEEHLKGFEEYNCEQCLLSLHYRLLVQARSAKENGQEELFQSILHQSQGCYTEEWTISNRVGYHSFEQSRCEGFSMSRFPVSYCGMKVDCAKD